MATPPVQTASHPLTRGDPRLRRVGRLLRGVEAVSPRSAAAMADALFSRTTRKSPRPEELLFLREAVAGSVRVSGQRIATYRWHGDGPRVLFAHGWSSHPGRFAPMARSLRAAGADLVAFDGPGHGRSSGWRATMPEFARAMRVVADRHGPFDAVIGHSLGGAAAIFAASRGMTVPRIVTIAAPAAIAKWLDHLRDAMGLSPRVVALLRERMMRRIDVTIEEIDMPRVAAQLTARGLVIHDDDDPDVPVAEAAHLVEAWPDAALMKTHGLGHRAILRDPEVIRAAVQFAMTP